MRKYLLVFSVSLLPVLGYCQRVHNAEATGSSATGGFEGSWAGEEKCLNISAPQVRINISVQGDEATISGLYSSIGTVQGHISNNVIAIPKQVVQDPMFKNLKIQGNLTLSKNHSTIEGLYMIFNNDARDDCSATYHRD